MDYSSSYTQTPQPDPNRYPHPYQPQPQPPPPYSDPSSIQPYDPHSYYYPSSYDPNHSYQYYPQFYQEPTSIHPPGVPIPAPDSETTHLQNAYYGHGVVENQHQPIDSGSGSGQAPANVEVAQVASQPQVLNLRGQKLEVQLLEIAKQQEADEFIIGLPRWSDGKETPQSNKVRSVAGRLAASAAERGWRVYLQDENGTSIEAMSRMINMGLSRSDRQSQIDAYAAMMVLERYFSMSGEGIELVLPKNLDLQERLEEVHRKMLIISLKTMRIDYSHCNCQTPSLFMSLVYSFKRSIYNGEVAII